MDKLKLAHDYFMKHVNTDQYRHLDDEDLISWSFDYVDAMQAEADKRINKERPDVLLTKDKDGNCLHFHREFGRKKCMDCGASLEEWQPDWSQAPDDMVKYFAVDEDGCGGWYINKPDLCFDYWYWSGLGERAPSYEDVDNFGYQGNWKESLRKRPEALCEVDWRVAPKNAFQWQIINNEAYWRIEIMGGMDTEPAPSFGFTGSHIVERPNGF